MHHTTSDIGFDGATIFCRLPYLQVIYTCMKMVKPASSSLIIAELPQCTCQKQLRTGAANSKPPLVSSQPSRAFHGAAMNFWRYISKYFFFFFLGVTSGSKPACRPENRNCSSAAARRVLHSEMKGSQHCIAYQDRHGSSYRSKVSVEHAICLLLCLHEIIQFPLTHA